MVANSQKSLKLSLFDAFFFSLMVGVGETYLPAYALSIGMSEWMTGLFATLPMVAGALMQLVAPWFVAKLGNVKRWVVFSASCQALSFLPLLYFTFYPPSSFLWFFVVVSLYYGAGFASGPAWNFWMESLVPEAVAPQFFAQRHRISQIGILLGLVGGGLALQANMTVPALSSVFSILFFIAFLGRLLSSVMLSLKASDPDWKYDEGLRALPRSIGRFLKIKSYREFFSFLFLFYITIFISSPFVTPFFLEKMKMSYQEYMIALGALFIAKIAVLPLAGPLIKKWGVKKVFFLGAIGISPLPALWSLNHDFWFVITLQAVSGAFWGLFEVALSVVFFHQIQGKEKIPLLTLYNLFNATAIVLGATFGGQILRGLGESLDGYFAIFVLGSALRLLLSVWYCRRTFSQNTFLPVNTTDEINSYSGPISKRVRTF